MPDMREVRVRPHPRGVFFGLDATDIARLEPIFPTATVVDTVDDVNYADWDVLVTTEPFVRDDMVPGDVSVVFVTGSGNLGSVAEEVPGVFRLDADNSRHPISVAAQLQVPDDLPGPYRRLLPALLDAVDERGPHSCLLAGAALRLRLGWGTTSAKGPLELINPIVATSDGYPVAGWWTRRGGPGVALSLPRGGTDIVDWTAAALLVWHELDPIRFPQGEAEWQTDPKWATPDEDVARSALAEAEADRDRQLAALDERVSSSQRALQTARAAGDAGPRILLTGTGDPLHREAAEALRRLGFGVQEMDQIWPENDRREDLRVTDPDDPNWIALAEVTGLRGGPKVSDLLSLTGRFRRRFTQDEGREPTRIWYIVNQRILQQPDRRPSHPGFEQGDLASYIAEGGLILDTRTLFQLDQATARGQRSPEEIRRQLRDELGYLAPE